MLSLGKKFFELIHQKLGFKKIPASSCVQSPPPQKNTIRALKSRYDDNVSSNPESLEEKAKGKEKKEQDELVSKLTVRFGPIYGDDTEPNRRAKDSAWKHILQNSGGDGEAEIESRYMSVIKKEAIDSYDIKGAPDLQFRQMMATDGCFFLQLALHLLGAGDHLDYPQQHPYFGKGSDSSSWIPAMFFPGNQIPYAVINALMKQDFFQKVIQKGKWRSPAEDDLAKLVLYQTVVEPHLKMPRHRRRDLPPSDVLQALHTLLLGSGGGDKDLIHSEMRSFQDLETGEDDRAVKFPSAGELKKLGIKMTKTKRGIANIRFRNLGYSAFLYLPPFVINGNTKDLLTSLANHEHCLSESDRELTAYLRFMRDLARTYKDFKILERKGIIQVKDAELKSSTILMLDNLVSLHDSKFTLNFCQIRRRIADYGGPPWRLISFILGALGVIQTIVTVISYVKPRK